VRFKNLFFATDFSDCAAHAQAYTFALAKRFDAALHVAHVVDTAYPSYAGVYGFGTQVDLHINEVKKHAQEHTMRVVDEANAAGIEAHPHVLSGHPAEASIDKAIASGCDLIVIGTHGRSGFDHFLFGSTCERVVRLSPIPVLSIKPEEREFLHDDGRLVVKRVLCPCDLSAASLLAADLAADFARLFGAEILLLHTVDNRVDYPLLMPNAELPTTAELREHAVVKLGEIADRYGDIESRVEVITGVPHKSINEIAERDDADIVVMSTHGRTGLTRALLGSTVEKVVRTSRVPTLTTRPAQSEKDEQTVHAAGLKPTLAV